MVTLRNVSFKSDFPVDVYEKRAMFCLGWRRRVGWYIGDEDFLGMIILVVYSYAPFTWFRVVSMSYA